MTIVDDRPFDALFFLACRCCRVKPTEHHLVVEPLVETGASQPNQHALLTRRAVWVSAKGLLGISDSSPVLLEVRIAANGPSIVDRVAGVFFSRVP